MSFGGNQSSSSSRSAQDAWNRSINQSASAASNASQSFIDPTQAGFLNNLWGQASGFGGGAQAAQDAAMGQSQVNAGMLGQAMQNLGQIADPNRQINAQTQSLQAGLGQLFRNEINPAIEGGAIGAGGFGGGRQGVAQGVAAGEMAQAFTQGLGDIVARANQTALGANAQIPGLAQAAMGNRLSPYGAGLDVLQQLGGILGGPTVLQKSTGSSGSMATGTSAGGSRARSRGGSSSGGFSFGIPFV